MPGDRFIELARSEDRHVLDVLFQHAGEAVTVQDVTGALVYANDRAAELVGLRAGREMLEASVADLVSRFEMIDESGAPMPLDALAGRRVLAGEAVAEQTIGYRLKDSLQVRWSRLRASPIRNDAGAVVWVVNHFLDITEEVRRRGNERVLARVTEVLGESMGLEETLRSLVSFIVPGIGQWGGVHLVDDDDVLMAVAAVFPEGTETRVLGALSDQERIPLDADRIQARVARSGKPEVILDLTDDMIAAAEEREGPELGDILRRLQIRSVACLPLRVGDSTLGTLTIAKSGSGGGLDEWDLGLLTSIAERAGVALANEKVYRQGRETAEALRRGLTPHRFPEVPGLQFAARYEPYAQSGHLGGDFYEVVELPTGVAAVIGDIEGKGIPAAAAVGLARHTLAATLRLDPTPHTVVNQLNSALLAEDPPRMCTLAYLFLSRRPESFELQTTLAGHPPPFLIRADGSVQALGRPGPPAGLFPAVHPEVDTVELRGGDTVLAFTDGFSDRDSTPPETLEPMLAGAAQEALEDLLDRLIRTLHSHPETARDDIALLALRFE